MPRWEYALLRLTRDPGQEGVPVFGWLWLPGDEAWRELKDPKGLLHLNELGSEGWEMIAPPTTQNAVFTYKAASDVWHDRACWVEKDFWLKRMAEE
jgi:hypothetical protein